MRLALARPVTPLLGSLGLHAGVALALLIAVRHPARVAEAEHARPDAWLGNAVEVDAVATPEATPDVPSNAAAQAEATAPAPESASATRAPIATEKRQATALRPAVTHPITP